MRPIRYRLPPCGQRLVRAANERGRTAGRMTGNGHAEGSCLAQERTSEQRNACREALQCNPYDLLSAANPARHAPFFSLAASTQRTYTFAWRRFVDFCSAHELVPLPAHPSTIKLFVEQLLREPAVQDGVRPGRLQLRDRLSPRV